MSAIRDELLRTASAQDIEVTAYCFMPDHLHALIEGRRADANLAEFTTKFRQRSGYRHRQRHCVRLWQDGYVDRVLRDDEASRDVVSYIIANPVRAGLCEHPNDYAYSGSSRYSIGELAESVQWKPDGSLG